MTQLELAERLGLTDKAVSKWERDLACPDVYSGLGMLGIAPVSLSTLQYIKK